MPTSSQRQLHEQWLLEITSIPTAAGREQRVIAWIREWVKARRNLQLREDRAGNLVVSRRTGKPGARTSAKRGRNAAPIFITAHLDHPAFVVRSLIDSRTIELEFRGGVNDPYYENAWIEIIDQNEQRHDAQIVSLDAKAKPFKRVTAKLATPHAPGSIIPGDIARWLFDERDVPFIKNGNIYTHACDDLAAVAAALATLESVRNRKACEHVGLLFTRAEEIGFIGAIAACKHKSIPKSARLICLENSRSFAESPIGGGPIVRVGDKMSVFEPNLTNQISLMMLEHQKTTPQTNFKWQRKLMPGGTCEATTFSTFGYRSTCICLPLANYHNMMDIDEVAAGKRPAKVGPEFVSLADYHGMIEMLVLCATQLDSAEIPSLKDRMNGLYKEHANVLGE